MHHILTQVFDLGGTFVFAISGGIVAVGRRMDIFGVLVLAFAAGNAGGITRDLLIGAVPPAAIAGWSYPAVSMFAGLITFWQFPLYALAALAGAAVVAGGDVLHVQPLITTIVGALLCFALRFMAIQYGWHLPSAKWTGGGHDESDSAGGDGGGGKS